MPGKYNPRYMQIDRDDTGVKYKQEPPNYGFERKKQLNLGSMSICPHAIRVIEDWASKKAATSCFSPLSQRKQSKQGAGTAFGSRSPNSPRTGAAEASKEFAKKRNTMTANPDASPRKQRLNGEVATKTGPGPRAATRNERRRQKNAVLRGVVPTN